MLSARYKEEMLLSESDMLSFSKSTELRIESLKQARNELTSRMSSSLAIVHVPNAIRHKFDSKAKDCWFIGYHET
jgi:hypothetical protein